MAREWFALVMIAAAPGCSLLLDFSDKAAPHDAMLDAPYTPDECAFGEPDDTPGTAFPMTPGTDTGPAGICPPDLLDAGTGADDLDYYKFTVPAGTTTATISIDFTQKLGDLDLILFNLADTSMPVAQSRGFVDGEKIVCPNAPSTTPICPTLAAGDYVFEVLPGTPGATNAYSYHVTLQ